MIAYQFFSIKNVWAENAIYFFKPVTILLPME